MQENELKDIIIVEQLPVITEKLQLISNEIEKEVEYALSLECNEDTKQQVKQERSKINKIKNELESKRKQVKQLVMNPYMEFEEIYNNLVKDKLTNADNKLKEKIDTIEQEQKLEKETELRQFSQNWFINKGIEEFVKFEDINLNITLSASIKSLEDKIIAFCEKVASDISLLNTMTYPSEMIYEYKNNGFDLNKAISIVNERKKATEKIKLEQEKLEQLQVENESVVEKVEEVITTPKEIIEEEIIGVEFKVYGTITQIKELKQFIEERGLKYE